MTRMLLRLGALLCAASLMSTAAFGQPGASRVLFRVFLTDGRVLTSYGEWSRLADRVILSTPTQLTRDPIELKLITIPADRVDWKRTEEYAESVRAAAYAATRGDADFAVFSAEVAKVLQDVSKIRGPAARLRAAEQARQRLADWPAQHYGYRIKEVREALNVLDEVILEMRIAAGIMRFDLSLSANSMPEPPPPPLPPPTDAELAEQLVTAASIAETPAERVGLLQTVLQVLSRAVGMSSEWLSRMKATVTGELAEEQRIDAAYHELRRKSLEDAANLAQRGQMSDLEKLRDRVRAEDTRLGLQRPGEVAALLATIDVVATSAIGYREAKREFDRLAPAFRRYRRSTNSIFKVFTDAETDLEQVKAMNGPPVMALPALRKRLAEANRKFRKVVAPFELDKNHQLIANAWDLADNALQLRAEAVASNSLDIAQRASSAATGALMLYRKARAEQLRAMEPPSRK